MTLPTPAALREALPAGTRRVLVAFSGGVDSSVLLHLARDAGLSVRALHVHHGLSAEADAWVEHCQTVCAALGIPLEVRYVRTERRGIGVQAGARNARYGALAEACARDEAVLVGQHADDQAETVLQRLLRGTGPDGLAGMAPVRAFAEGWLLRPLLAATREEILAYARAQGLEWIEDSGNQSCVYQRNRIRHRLLPALQAEAPGVVAALNQLAGDARAEHAARDWLLAEQCHACEICPAGPLRVSRLAALPATVTHSLLRYWVRQGGWRPPGRRRLLAGVPALLDAGADRHPQLAWRDGQIVRHAGVLFRLPPCLPDRPPPQAVNADAAGSPDSTIDWCGQGVIRFTQSPVGTGIAAAALPWIAVVRVAGAGERVRLAGSPLRPVRELLREAGVPPWWRERWPLLTDARDRVIGIPGIGAGQGFAAGPHESAMQACWIPARAPQGADWSVPRVPLGP